MPFPFANDDINLHVSDVTGILRLSTMAIDFESPGEYGSTTETDSTVMEKRRSSIPSECLGSSESCRRASSTNQTQPFAPLPRYIHQAAPSHPITYFLTTPLTCNTTSLKSSSSPFSASTINNCITPISQGPPCCNSEGFLSLP